MNVPTMQTPDEKINEKKNSWGTFSTQDRKQKKKKIDSNTFKIAKSAKAP